MRPGFLPGIALFGLLASGALFVFLDDRGLPVEDAVEFSVALFGALTVFPIVVAVLKSGRPLGELFRPGERGASWAVTALKLAILLAVAGLVVIAVVWR